VTHGSGDIKVKLKTARCLSVCLSACLSVCLLLQLIRITDIEGSLLTSHAAALLNDTSQSLGLMRCDTVRLSGEIF